MKNSTSGFFSASQLRTGAKPSKIGAQTGSSAFCVSTAYAIAGVCEAAMPPTIFAKCETPSKKESDYRVFGLPWR